MRSYSFPPRFPHPESDSQPAGHKNPRSSCAAAKPAPSRGAFPRPLAEPNPSAAGARRRQERRVSSSPGAGPRTSFRGCSQPPAQPVPTGGTLVLRAQRPSFHPHLKASLFSQQSAFADTRESQFAYIARISHTAGWGLGGLSSAEPTTTFVFTYPLATGPHILSAHGGLSSTVLAC